ncbi:MAG TPA: hypothetical protein VEB86_08920 [Chryseosolibacter sp.]|nr:hypothetical protein [Chryseosolibacter sp.]
MKILAGLLLIVVIPAFGQKKIKTIELSDSIKSAYVDRVGELYVITRGGQVQRYDADGKLQILYRADDIPTLFDPRDGARLFAYYRSTQTYQYLNPSFEITKAYRIDSSFAIEPWLICPSGDHKLWVLDAVDHSLKRLNPKESVVEVEVVIDSVLIRDARLFTTMREYQGFVFLFEPGKGIHIFSAMGKHIKTIAAPGSTSFHFLGEEMYYRDGSSIRFLDLFSAEGRAIQPVQKSGDILLTDIRLFHVQDLRVDIYEYTP